LPQKLAVPCYL